MKKDDEKVIVEVSQENQTEAYTPPTLNEHGKLKNTAEVVTTETYYY
jgi:hypothetical protein